jgi:maltose O-acetyltransferase
MRLPWFLKKRINLIWCDVRSLFRTIIGGVPGYAGSYLRTIGYPYLSIGQEVTIQRSFWVEYPELLSIGNRVQINQHCFFNAGGGIQLGDDILIGPYVIIYSQNHNYINARILIRLQDYSKKKVVIEDDVWIGSRAIVLPGVKIQKGTVVAAGSVVTRDTEEYSVVAGVPAKKIGTRKLLYM